MVQSIAPKLLTAMVFAGAAACGGSDALPAAPRLRFAEPIANPHRAAEFFDGIGIAIDPEGLTSGDTIRLISGSEIFIMNADNTAHQIASDGLDRGEVDDPCAELNLPVLQSYEEITFKITGPARTCSFHDHLNHDAWYFRATIQLVSEVYRNSH